VLQTGECL